MLYIGGCHTSIDGFHGSEIVYGRILEKIVMDNSSVKQYVDLDRINTINGTLAPLIGELAGIELVLILGWSHLTPPFEFVGIL